MGRPVLGCQAQRRDGRPGGTRGRDRNQIKLKTPGTPTYRVLEAQRTFGPTDQAYQRFRDVTDDVRAAGPGTYWAADVAAGTGEDRYGGWTLTVVYRNPALPLRNLTVFDGFADVGQGEPVTVGISGFLAPETGAVDDPARHGGLRRGPRDHRRPRPGPGQPRHPARHDAVARAPTSSTAPTTSAARRRPPGRRTT